MSGYDKTRFVPSTAEDVLRARVKGELRKRLRGVRKSLPESSALEKSSAIVDRLRALPAIAGARAVALYWPMLERREVDLRGLDRELRARGVRVAYPSIMREDGAVTEAMTFRFVDDPSALEDGGYGFLEPAESAPEVSPGELSVIVAPALAVDPCGHRLGYGAGYYDRTLARYAPPAVTVAVAYDFGLLAELPSAEFDVPVDWIVTDARTLARE